jgi:hypothetical protein
MPLMANAFLAAVDAAQHPPDDRMSAGERHLGSWAERPSQRLSLSDNETSHGSPSRGAAANPEPTSFVRTNAYLVTMVTLPIRAWSLAGLLRLLEEGS